MVLCLVFLVIFAILGLFSAKYRKLAKEAFACVGKSLIFKPCASGLDQRFKTKVTSKIMTRSKIIAKIFYKYFTLLSWAFTIAFFVSLYFTAIALYNYARFGTCEPGLPAKSCPINQAISLLTCTTAQYIYLAIIIFVGFFLVYRYATKK